MWPIQLQCRALLQVACVRVVSNQVLFDHMKEKRAYTLLNPPLTVYFLQGCYYFRAVATLQINNTSKSYIIACAQIFCLVKMWTWPWLWNSHPKTISKVARVHRLVHVLIKLTSSVIYQKQRTQRFFRSLYKNDACLTKKNPLSLQVILLPKKDNVHQLHACSLYS